MKKSQNVPVWLRKLALAQYNCTIYGGWKRRSETWHLQKKSVLYMMCLLLSVSECPIITIGPGGLLLVVLHLFAVHPVSVLWFGVPKVNN
jgi:hypothetical protein